MIHICLIETMKLSAEQAMSAMKISDQDKTVLLKGWQAVETSERSKNELVS